MAQTMKFSEQLRPPGGVGWRVVGPGLARIPLVRMKTSIVLIFTAWLVCLSEAVAGWASVYPFEQAPIPRPKEGRAGKLDEIFAAKLRQAGLRAANPCSDGVFLRRVYLDAIGTLPMADEAWKFLDDKSPNKRAALIDRLLERPEFADFWGLKWADALRVKSEFPVNLWPNAAQAYDRWIRDCIRENRPLSDFARDLLTASGSNFRSPAVNFCRSAGSREPKDIARMAALVFMGQRAEKWPPAKLDALAVFFSRIGFKKSGEWKEEIVYFDGIDANLAAPVRGTLPDGSHVDFRPDQDPRKAFADWLLTSKASPFAANMANRIWCGIFGRGLVHEPDDMRADNPATCPEALAWLADELTTSKYDLKNLCRIIFNSATYQLSPIPPDGQGHAGDGLFASYPVRRLEAEVLIDAINQVTGATEEYSSMIPEPFTFMPPETRSITLPDASITSSFLETFGRPPRDTGFFSERNDRMTTSQRLHLLNSTHILSKINKSPTLKGLVRREANGGFAVSRLYLTILSRLPTSRELDTIKAHAQIAGGRTGSDIAWALMNTPEFLYRH